MNRKSMVFTLITLLFLISMLMLSLTYYRNTRDPAKQLSGSLAGDRMRYLEDDTAGSIYTDLFSTDLPAIAHLPGETILNFSGIILSETSGRQSLIEEYSQFVQSNYSGMTNIHASLENLSGKFRVEPFGSEISIADSNLTVSGQNSSALQQIIISVRVDRQLSALTSNTTPPDTGTTAVSVNIYDSDGNFVAGADSHLDPSAYNIPFSAAFGSSLINISFGNLVNGDGTLLIDAEGLEANITLLSLAYSQSDTLSLVGGRIHLLLPAWGMEKNADIILKRG